MTKTLYTKNTLNNGTLKNGHRNIPKTNSLFFQHDLNYLRKIICLRKSENSVEIISICNDIEKLGGAWHRMYTMLRYNDIIDLLP